MTVCLEIAFEGTWFRFRISSFQRVFPGNMKPETRNQNYFPQRSDAIMKHGSDQPTPIDVTTLSGKGAVEVERHDTAIQDNDTSLRLRLRLESDSEDRRSRFLALTSASSFFFSNADQNPMCTDRLHRVHHILV